MIDSIAQVIVNRMTPYNFIDKISGVVTETKEVQEKSVNIFPKATDVVADDCEFGVEVMMIPDTKYKSVSYLEDQGTFPISVAGTVNNGFETRFRYVCWLNMYKLGEESNINHVCDAIIATTIRELQDIRGVNDGYTRKLTVKVNQLIGNNRMSEIFSKWTYNEEVTQFLTWPYRAFALDLRIRYEISRSCIDTIADGTPIDCLQKELANPN